MKKTVILKGTEQYSQVLRYLDEVQRSDDLHEVLIRPHTSSMSVRQQGYYFGVVLKSISEHTGSHPDELHLEYKKKFQIPIMEKYPDDYENFAGLMASLRVLWQEGKTGHAQKFYDFVVQEISIMDLKRPHKAEYIDEVIRHAAEFLHFAVPPPEPDILRR